MKNPAAAFGSRDRKKATAGLKRASRSGVAGARKKKNNQAKRAKQTAADTYQRLHLAKEAGKKLTKAQEKALAKHEAAFYASRGLTTAEARKKAAAFDQAEKARGRAVGRILGPSGVAHAVKISRVDGRPFNAADVEAWRRLGWGVAAAGSVAGRVGAGAVPGVVMGADDFTFTNPDTLGPSGLARALVLIGRVDADLVDQLAADGYDVAAAPKKLREQIHKNPAPAAPAQKAVYSALVAAFKKRQALRVDELAEKLRKPLEAVQEAVARLLELGLVHEYGRDLFGSCYAPGAPARGLFDNPAPGRKAEKKAAAWYQRESLTTGAKTIRLPDTVEAVEVGKIVSITYESDKYDGRKRLWKHDVTGNRTLHISTDGKVLVVLPGFKITKRGIEG